MDVLPVVALDVGLDPPPNTRLALLLLIDIPRVTRDKVHLVGANHASAVEELVAQQEDKEERDTKVSGDEGRGVEVVHERREAREDDDNDRDHKAVVAEERLEGGTVRKRAPVDTLCAQAAVEPDRGVQDCGPRNHAAHGCHVGD